MRYPLVLDLAADGIPVAVTCRVLGLLQAGLLRVAQQPCHVTGLGRRAPDQRRARHPPMTRSSATGSSPTNCPATASPPGRTGSRGCARSSGSGRCTRKKRGLNRKAGPPVHDDLVAPPLHRRTARTSWLTDITEHPTGEGKLYLCAIKDVHSNRIVGYSIDSRMKADLAVRALRNAIALRDPARTSVHSDRGSQFRSTSLRPHPGQQRPGRIDGPRRRLRRQRRHGVLLRAAAEERPEPASAGAPANNCAWQSSPGSSGPTTAAAVNAHSADSPP